MAPCDTCGAMLEVGQQQLTHVCSGAPRYACLHCDHEAPTVNPVIVPNNTGGNGRGVDAGVTKVS